jgi:hypothetical protein
MPQEIETVHSRTGRERALGSEKQKEKQKKSNEAEERESERALRCGPRQRHRPPAAYGYARPLTVTAGRGPVPFGPTWDPLAASRPRAVVY